MKRSLLTVAAVVAAAS